MNSTTNSNPALERVLRDLAEGNAYPPLKTLQGNKIIKEEEEETLSITSSTVDQSSHHSLSDKEPVIFDWEKPLNKITKEDKPHATSSSTILVRIVKPALPEDQNAHDAQIPKRKDRKNFYNNKNNFKNFTKKTQPKTNQAPNNKNLSKPQIQQPKRIAEEVKEEIIGESENLIQKAVSLDWEKPLKKVPKEDKLQTTNSSTILVRIVKPALPEDQNAHDAQIPKRKDRKNFFNNKTFKESAKKNQAKTTQVPKNQNLPKPQIQPKPIEEVKEEIIEEPVNHQVVISDWDKPVKKISKEDKPQTLNSSTVILRVVKSALPDDQNAHDAQIPKRKDRKNFYNNKNNSKAKKNQLKTQAPKKGLPKPQPKEEVKEKITEEPPRNISD